MQAFTKKPVGDEAKALLATVYAETAEAMQSHAHWFVRASLEMQLGCVQEAQYTLELFGQHLADFAPPCWLAHFRVLLHWSTGEVEQVSPCSTSEMAASWCRILCVVS